MRLLSSFDLQHEWLTLGFLLAAVGIVKTTTLATNYRCCLELVKVSIVIISYLMIPENLILHVSFVEKAIVQDLTFMVFMLHWMRGVG